MSAPSLARIVARQSTTNPSSSAPANSVSGFLSTAIPLLAVASALLATFLVLRVKRKRLYQPRTFVATIPSRNRTPKTPDSRFGWIPSFWRLPDEYILNHHSLDGFLFLRFIKLLAALCFFGCFSWIILFPVNATGHGGQSQFSALSISNIPNSGNRYYAQTLVGFIFWGLVLLLVGRESVFCYKIRQSYFLSSYIAGRISTRVVLFINVPSDYLDEGILRGVYPGANKIWLAQDTTLLRKLVKERTKNALRLEAAQCQLIEDVDKQARLEALASMKTEQVSGSTSAANKVAGQNDDEHTTGPNNATTGPGQMITPDIRSQDAQTKAVPVYGRTDNAENGPGATRGSNNGTGQGLMPGALIGAGAAVVGSAAAGAGVASIRTHEQHATGASADVTGPTIGEGPGQTANSSNVSNATIPVGSGTSAVDAPSVAVDAVAHDRAGAGTIPTDLHGQPLAGDVVTNATGVAGAQYVTHSSLYGGAGAIAAGGLPHGSSVSAGAPTQSWVQHFMNDGPSTPLPNTAITSIDGGNATRRAPLVNEQSGVTPAISHPVVRQAPMLNELTNTSEAIRGGEMPHNDQSATDLSRRGIEQAYPDAASRSRTMLEIATPTEPVHSTGGNPAVATGLAQAGIDSTGALGPSHVVPEISKIGEGAIADVGTITSTNEPLPGAELGSSSTDRAIHESLTSSMGNRIASRVQKTQNHNSPGVEGMTATNATNLTDITRSVRDQDLPVSAPSIGSSNNAAATVDAPATHANAALSSATPSILGIRSRLATDWRDFRQRGIASASPVPNRQIFANQDPISRMSGISSLAAGGVDTEARALAGTVDALPTSDGNLPTSVSAGWTSAIGSRFLRAQGAISGGQGTATSQLQSVRPQALDYLNNARSSGVSVVSSDAREKLNGDGIRKFFGRKPIPRSTVPLNRLDDTAPNLGNLPPQLTLPQMDSESWLADGTSLNHKTPLRGLGEGSADTNVGAQMLTGDRAQVATVIPAQSATDDGIANRGKSVLQTGQGRTDHDIGGVANQSSNALARDDVQSNSLQPLAGGLVEQKQAFSGSPAAVDGSPNPASNAPIESLAARGTQESTSTQPIASGTTKPQTDAADISAGGLAAGELAAGGLAAGGLAAGGLAAGGVLGMAGHSHLNHAGNSASGEQHNVASDAIHDENGRRPGAHGGTANATERLGEDSAMHRTPLGAARSATGPKEPVLDAAALGHGAHMTPADDTNPLAEVKAPIEGEALTSLVKEKRPKHREPSYNLLSNKVDSIDYCRKRLNELHDPIIDSQKQHRARDMPYVPAVFIEFQTVEDAEAAFGRRVDRAPQVIHPSTISQTPHQIIWKNLLLSSRSRKLRSILAIVAFVLILLFWSIPVAFVGALSNISALETINFLSFLQKVPGSIIGIITGLIPTILLSLVMSLVPPIIRWLGRFAGITSTGSLELYVQKYYFIFQFVQVFLMTTITSSAAASGKVIASDPASAASLLAISIPKSSNFYINYFVLYGINTSVQILVDLAAVVNFDILARLQVKKVDKTPRTLLHNYITLPGIQWGSQYPVYTNLCVIAIIFAMIAPLLLGFASVAFALVYIAFRYQLLYAVDVSEINEQGRGYALALQQLLVGVYAAEILLILIFAINAANSVAAAGPLVLMVLYLLSTIAFHLLLNWKLNPYKSSLIGAPFAEGPHVDDTKYSRGSVASGAHDMEKDSIDKQDYSTDVAPADRGMPADFHGNCLRCWLNFMFDPKVVPTMAPELYEDVHPGYSWEDYEYSYMDPVITAEAPLLWLPRDAEGISAREIEANMEDGIRTTDEGAWLDGKSKAVTTFVGQDESEDDLARALPVYEHRVDY